MERRGLGEALFEEINADIHSRDHRLKRGTIVDSSIIEALGSTKNNDGKRDPEMHQTKVGHPFLYVKCHFGYHTVR